MPMATSGNQGSELQSRALEGTPLSWVKGEIDETLRRAESALERYADDPTATTEGQGTPVLQSCLEYLHEITGTLRIIEVQGGTLLAEEMEQLLTALIRERAEPNALEVLMQGLLQLPDYLERLQGGARDLPVALLPLINELRDVRHEAHLTPDLVFYPYLLGTPLFHPVSSPVAGGEPNTARRARSLFQSGLVAWSHDAADSTALQRMMQALEQLYVSATHPLSMRLWWIGAGLVEVAQDKGVDAASTRPLFGRLERQIKRYIDGGEEDIRNNPPLPLMRQMLYHIAHSRSQGTLVLALQEAFRLHETLSDQSDLAAVRNSLRGANRSVMATVSVALHEDLMNVMGALDLFVRKQTQDVAELQPLIAQIRQIAGTVTVIDQEEARQELLTVSEVLTHLVASGNHPSTPGTESVLETLSKLALRLVQVESILASLSDHSQGSEDLTLNFAVDEQHLRHSVFQQAIVSLARAKESIATFTQEPTSKALETASAALAEVSGGLTILDLHRPCQLATACARALPLLQEPAAPTAAPTPPIAGTPGRENLVEHLADAIAALELYLEEQLEDRTGENFLAQGESAIASLPTPLPASNPPPPRLPAEETSSDLFATEPDPISVIELSSDEPAAEPDPISLIELSSDEPATEPDWISTIELSSDEPATEPDWISVDELISKKSSSPTEPALNATAATQQGPDPEMVEVFSEEATEEIAVLDHHLPHLRAAVDAPETMGKEGGAFLRTMRRSFHTLKGSGRMVGATRLSELAWAVENLLNRIIDGTTSVSHGLLHVIEDARLALPLLLEDFRTSRSSVQGVEEIEAQAWRLARAGLVVAPITETVAKESALPIKEPLATETEVVRPRMDPALLKLFETETQTHLRVVETTLKTCRSHSDCPATHDLLHALHTLRGSARMAQVDGIAAIGKALEQHVRTCAAAEKPLRGSSLPMIETGVRLIRDSLRSLTGSTSPPDINPWLEEIKAATSAIVPLEAVPMRESGGIDEITQMFLNEAMEALKGCEQIVSEWQAQPTAVTALQPLRALLKTLANGAEIVGIVAIATLCRTCGTLIERAATDPRLRNEDTIQLCSETIEHLWVMLESVRDYEPAVLPNALCDALVRQTQTASVPTSPPAPTLPATRSEAPPERIEAERGELMTMFLTEAEDLIGSMDNLSRQLFTTPGNTQMMGELRRALHTLKGGARMVRVQAIADLAHTLESMLDSVVDGHLPASQRLIELIQSASDHLSEMIDRVREGLPVEAATVLHHHIENLVTQQLLSSPDDPKRSGQPTPLRSTPPPEEKTASRSGTRAPAAEARANRVTFTETSSETPQASDQSPADLLEPERRSSPRVVQEQVRVTATLLNQLVNYAAEVSITRSRVDQQMAGQRHSLQEMAQTVARLRDQWRKLEIETEVQILRRHQALENTDFDPLELERYSTLQQLSRGLIESVSDLASLHGMLMATTRDAEMLLLQQSRITKELQEGLMRTRMVPFAVLAQRLRRIVRQTAQELNIHAELQLVGADIELDRTVLDRMVAPLEHMLRNAISHGLEPPALRRAAGKPETGVITISLRREGQEVVISVSDDGHGLDLAAIRRKAQDRGLLAPNTHLADREVMQFIVEPGFSTAGQVTQISGRGVGMDVVLNEVRLLGGTLYIDSEALRSTTFTVRLPLTLAVNKSLLVNVQGDLFAISLVTILAVLQLPHEEVNRLYEEPHPVLTRGGSDYQFVHAATLLDAPLPPRRLAAGEKLPVLLFGVGDVRTALAVDGLLGARDIVVKSVGPQLGRVREISGATILGDGRVAVILDMSALIRKNIAAHGLLVADGSRTAPRVAEETGISVLVVDDSITVRRVTARLLERHHMTVLTARDGVDAVALLQKHTPDLILMDIEMPRMDGYELTTYIRSEPRLKHIPIVMITSRTGAKHRRRAAEVGVTYYLGKPYQETELLEAINSLRGHHPRSQSFPSTQAGGITAPFPRTIH